MIYLLGPGRKMDLPIQKAKQKTTTKRTKRSETVQQRTHRPKRLKSAHKQIDRLLFVVALLPDVKQWDICGLRSLRSARLGKRSSAMLMCRSGFNFKSPQQHVKQKRHRVHTICDESTIPSRTTKMKQTRNKIMSYINVS